MATHAEAMGAVALAAAESAPVRVLLPALAILDASVVDGADAGYATLRQEQAEVVAELRSAVEAVNAARARHLEEDDERAAEVRDAARSGGRPPSVSAELLVARRALEVERPWDEAELVVARLAECAARSSGWIVAWARLEADRILAGDGEAEAERRLEQRRRESGESPDVKPLASGVPEPPVGVRVDASRQELGAIGAPHVALDAARLRAWIAEQRQASAA